MEPNSSRWLAKRTKGEWVAVAAVAGLFLLIVAYLGYDTYQSIRAFYAMTPAQHLGLGRDALRDGFFGEALRHANAVTAGAEVAEARKLEAEIAAAKEAARRKEAEKDESRRAAVTNLESDLKNLGYDLKVTESSEADQITIESDDFGDTDHRVRLLSFLRGRNGPVAGVCFAGFQKVRLRSSFIPLFGFSNVYSLACP